MPQEISRWFVCYKRSILWTPKKELTCVLPYFGKKSLQLSSPLVNSVNKTTRFWNMKVVFRSQRKQNTLFRFKDSFDKKIRSVFLSIGISVVTTMILITVKLTAIFSLELRSVSNLTGKRLKNMKDSEVSDHLLQRYCTINLNHFDISATEVSKFNLLVKESTLLDVTIQS